MVEDKAKPVDTGLHDDIDIPLAIRPVLLCQSLSGRHVQLRQIENAADLLERHAPDIQGVDKLESVLVPAPLQN